MSRRHRFVRTGSFLLFGVIALGAMPAPVALAGRGATCVTRNVTQGTSSTSFRVVVKLARDGDRLQVRGTCRTRGIEIEKDLYIRGMDDAATLTGQARYRVLRVARGAVVTLRDLVLTHGVPASYDWSNLPGGGAISNRGTLTLIDSLVTENDAYFGGGIYNLGTLTLVRSRVSEHGAGWPGDKGDSIQGTGGGIYNTGTATLEDSVVAHNSTDYAGAGIANGGTLTLRRSRVSDNGSNYMGSGGGIANSGTLVLVDSEVTRNSGYDGGGIGNAGTVRMTGSTLSGNASYTSGGGIFNDRHGTVILRGGSTVTANTASNNGGGIFNRGKLTLRDSAVTTNTAFHKGGGIFNGAAGTVTAHGASSVIGNNPDDCVGTTAC